MAAEREPQPGRCTGRWLGRGGSRDDGRRSASSARVGIHTRLIEIYVLTGCLIESRVSPPRYKDHAPCPLATPPLRLLAPLLPLLLLVLLPFSLHSFAHSRRDSVQHPLGGLDMSSVSTSDEPGPSHLHESSELASLQEREETPSWEPRYVATLVCLRVWTSKLNFS